MGGFKSLFGQAEAELALRGEDDQGQNQTVRPFSRCATERGHNGSTQSFYRVFFRSTEEG